LPRIVGYLSLPALLTVPLGGYSWSLDPAIARKFISAVVMICSSLLLHGLRYDGAPKSATSMLLGGITGTLVGATSIGAPPVILYLLSGPEPAAVSRFNTVAVDCAITSLWIGEPSVTRPRTDKTDPCAQAERREEI
jgi:uncharacterized membrane protein YfcA